MFDGTRRFVAESVSITDYFKEKTTGNLKLAFRPAVEQAMSSNGVTGQYDELMAKAPTMPFGQGKRPSIDDYVISKALDGLFYVLAQQEKEIRTDPLARSTPLLRQVFGKG